MQQQEKQFADGGSSAMTMGMSPVREASLGTSPGVDQGASWPPTSNLLGPSPSLEPSPPPQGEEQTASLPWASRPKLLGPSPSLEPSPPPQGEEQIASLPWTSRPKATPRPEAAPQDEPSAERYYQKDRSPSVGSFYVPSGSAPSDARSIQTSNKPEYSHQEDPTPRDGPIPASSRNTNSDPPTRSALMANDKGVQAPPSEASMATKSGAASWVQDQLEQPTSAPAAFPLWKSTPPTLMEDGFVWSEPSTAAAGVTTSSDLANRSVHSTAYPFPRSVAGHAWGALEGGGDTPSSGGADEPIKSTPQPSSPSAPPAGGGSSSFSSSSGGGQAGSGGGIAPLLLLGVLLLGLGVSCPEGKLRRIFCVLPKPSSALLGPLERPG
jgi:hypothetical protein